MKRIYQKKMKRDIPRHDRIDALRAKMANYWKMKK